MRDLPSVMWIGMATAVAGLGEPWLDDWSGSSALGVVLVWELLTDRAAYDLLSTALGAVAVVGFVAAAAATLRRGPRWLVAVAAVGTATLPIVVVLHELWTGQLVSGVGIGVPLELAAAVVFGVAAALWDNPDVRPAAAAADRRHEPAHPEADPGQDPS